MLFFIFVIKKNSQNSGIFGSRIISRYPGIFKNQFRLVLIGTGEEEADVINTFNIILTILSDMHCDNNNVQHNIKLIALLILNLCLVLKISIIMKNEKLSALSEKTVLVNLHISYCDGQNHLNFKLLYYAFDNNTAVTILKS